MNKKKYVFLISIMVIGIVSGIIFSNILVDNDKILVEEKLTNYFINIKNNQEINYFNNFVNSFFNNTLTLIIISVMGLSIIGLVVNQFILFFKSFIIGFSIGSIINIYLYKGILGSILYIFPHVLINMFVYIILIYYANNYSIKLFNVIFKKNKKIDLTLKKYIKIFILGFIILIFSTLLEIYFNPIIIKLFTNLI